MKTQKDEVLRYLEENGSITSVQAFSELHITRLSSIIHRLRQKGLQIHSEMVDTTNIYSRRVQYAKYVLNDSN